MWVSVQTCAITHRINELETFGQLEFLTKGKGSQQPKHWHKYLTTNWRPPQNFSRSHHRLSDWDGNDGNRVFLRLNQHWPNTCDWILIIYGNVHTIYIYTYIFIYQLHTIFTNIQLPQYLFYLFYHFIPFPISNNRLQVGPRHHISPTPSTWNSPRAHPPQKQKTDIPRSSPTH